MVNQAYPDTSEITSICDRTDRKHFLGLIDESASTETIHIYSVTRQTIKTDTCQGVVESNVTQQGVASVSASRLLLCISPQVVNETRTACEDPPITEPQCSDMGSGYIEHEGSCIYTSPFCDVLDNTQLIILDSNSGESPNHNNGCGVVEIV